MILKTPVDRMSRRKVFEFHKSIDFKRAHPLGDDAATAIAALCVHRAIPKKQQGRAIALIFGYAGQTRKTTLDAVHLRFLG
jgi:hypothetical protein